VPGGSQRTTQLQVPSPTWQVMWAWPLPSPRARNGPVGTPPITVHRSASIASSTAPGWKRGRMDRQPPNRTNTLITPPPAYWDP
jgi:hypothetical protein